MPSGAGHDAMVRASAFELPVYQLACTAGLCSLLDCVGTMRWCVSLLRGAAY